MLKNKTAIKLLIFICMSMMYLGIEIPVDASERYIAAGSYNNYPYEFLDDDGKPAGFTVELFHKIAETMGIQFEMLLLPPERVAAIVEKGESDIIIGGIDSPFFNKYNYAGTAIELLFRFIARGDSGILDSRDLSSGQIAIAGNEIFYQPVSDIIRKLYKADTLYLSNPEKAFLFLSSKGCKAVFMPDAVLRKIRQNPGDGSIQELELNPGKFRYGFFVKKDDAELLNKLRTGLSGVYADGSYGIIYSRWFNTGTVSGKIIDKSFVALWSLLSSAVFILFIYINNRILGRRIQEKTIALNNTIADLKSLENELRRSEKKFRKIFNKSPAGIMILNSSGRILHYNESIKRIFGVINPDEIYNLNVIESPNSTEWFKARIKNYRSVTAEFRYNFDLIRETGFYATYREGEIIIDISIFPFSLHYGEGGFGYMCHIFDVTRSRSLLQFRNETVRRYELIFDSIRDGLWEWRLGDNGLKINRQFLSMLGYRKENFPSDFHGICRLIHPEEREHVQSLICDRITGGRSFTVEYRMLKNDGSWLWLRSRGEVIEWDHELQPSTVIATHTDISQLKDIEKKFAEDISMKRTENRVFENKGAADPAQGKKLLIVDDNCLIALHLSDLLTRIGYLCVNAMSGIEALEIVKRDAEFDLVLLDLEMPELDGFTTLKLLKDIRNDIPVIANTGHCDVNCTDELLCSGFDDVIGKPVQESLLLEKIEKLLSACMEEVNHH